MDFSKLESLEKHLHIISAIEKGASFGGDIWQTGSSGFREVFQIIKIQISENQQKIILRTDSLKVIEQDYPLFIRFRYRNIIFRLTTAEFAVMGDQLICSIPQDVKALAKRSSDRYVLPPNLDISLSIKRYGRTIKENLPQLEVRIIDISESGIGILISGANREFFRAYDHFLIRAIDHKVLNREIFGTVLYVAPKGYYLKRSEVRVGLSLSTPLSWDVFDQLKKKCQVVLSA